MKYAKKIYVQKEGHGKDGYLCVEEDPSELADTERTVEAGLYEFVGTVEIKAAISVQVTSKK
jgi:hypothetical protein